MPTWKIAGTVQADTPPVLPDGVTAERVALLPWNGMSPAGTTLRVHPTVDATSTDLGRLAVGSTLVRLDRATAHDLHAALGELLSQSPPALRAYADHVGDLWFEVAPDRFRCADSRAAAHTRSTSWARSLEYLEANWGPLAPHNEKVCGG